MSAPTIDIKTFLGVRNTGQSRRVPVGALATAINVDVDDEGGVVMRDGYEKSLAGANITAAYSPLHEDFTYIVDAGVLYRVDPTLNKYALGSVSTEPTYWAEAGNKILMSTGYIVDGDELLPWRVQPPPAPICRATSGSLPAGRYQVLMTATAADGRESGTSYVAILELLDNSGIQITNSSGYNVYLTEGNGTVFYPVGTGVSYIAEATNLVSPIADALLLNNTLPDSVDQIAYYDTCAYYSQFDQANNTTYIAYSQPYRWHVFDLFNNYLQVPGEVRLLVGTKNALVIGTDKAIYLYDGQELLKAASYGVPHGHNWSRGTEGYVIINTERGPCTVDPFTNLTQDNVSLPAGRVCSTAIVAKHGITKFITLTDGIGTANNAT